jgi:hypothetical protein
MYWRKTACPLGLIVLAAPLLLSTDRSRARNASPATASGGPITLGVEATAGIVRSVDGPAAVVGRPGDLPGPKVRTPGAPGSGPHGITPTVAAAVAAGKDGGGADKPTAAGGADGNPGRPEPAPTGWLILDGRLIPGPYDVAIVDDGIRIDGLSIEPPPGPAVPITVTPEIVAQHEVLESLSAALQKWTKEGGAEAACTHALEFMRSQALVEEVVLHSETSLRVLFRGVKYPEYVDLSASPPDEPSLERVRAEYLDDQARALRYWLTHGSLVIFNRGVLMATPTTEGAAMLKQLRDLVARNDDVDVRAAAVGVLIPEPGMARAIAERLRPE